MFVPKKLRLIFAAVAATIGVLAVCGILVSVSAGTLNKTAQKPEATANEALKSKLADAIAELKDIQEVRPAPLPGLLELRINGTDILYTTPDGSHIFAGNIIDTASKVNLTEQRVMELSAVDFDKLPLEHAFPIIRGDGSRKMALFTDPNCPFCKRFEQELMKVTNVTIHVFLMPVLGQDSMNKSAAIWCSPDRGSAYLEWMLRGKEATGPACEVDALVNNLKFGQKHRITGTPTTIFSDNQRVAGLVQTATVEEHLATASKQLRAQQDARRISPFNHRSNLSAR